MVQKALTYKATMHRLKPMFFSQLTLLSNNLVLMSYLRGILLRIFLGYEEECRKHWKVNRTKNEEYEERQITTIYIFGFKLYLTGKYSLKNVVYTFIPWKFIYSLYALQNIRNTIMIHPISINMNIQIII